jgi:hypothetical protein
VRGTLDSGASSYTGQMMLLYMMFIIYESCGPYGSHLAPYCRRIATSGSCMHHMGAIWEPRVPYGSCVFAKWEWGAPYRSWMGAVCSCGGHMVQSRRWMVPYGSCVQHIAATGTMWEPYGSCVGCIGGGWLIGAILLHVGGRW